MTFVTMALAVLDEGARKTIEGDLSARQFAELEDYARELANLPHTKRDG
jgi:hypothetical protein